MVYRQYFLLFILCIGGAINSRGQQNTLKLNDLGYFEMPGLNVMVFQDIYPEGHQGGVGIIQNGTRVATNGDLRLEAAPGQWAPIPVLHKRTVDKENNLISVSLSYPDSSRNRKGFNPISYPDLYFTYTINVKAEGAAIHVTVDLDKPLPKEWEGKVGFNLEFFPPALFGKGWYLDQQSGVFPRQANSSVALDDKGEIQSLPFASGKRLVIAPETRDQRMTIESKKTDIQLFDARNKQNNGWFVVRSLVAGGATKGAIEWTITPEAIPGWKYKPVIHVSQIGYHPKQQKIAVIELDASDKTIENASLMRVSENNNPEQVLSSVPKVWGKFLRYNYAQFDFSSIAREGLYYIQYGASRTELFRISDSIYKNDVWQPTLEYFLPIQMCHMRVNEKYRVWHGLCHMDDALMAPVNHIHFDGYFQGPGTLTRYKPLEPVPGLNLGGWHDAGDDDLRVESQAGEIAILSLAYEAFKVNYDNTSIDQHKHLVEIHQPDGKPDLLQQIENGALTVVSGYRNLGRLYRGIISPTLKQYTLMGDVSNQTDNLVYDPNLKENQKTGTTSGKPDDRWVFTENNPPRELATAADLATGARTLKGYNDTLASQCLMVAEEIWKTHRGNDTVIVPKLHAAIELFITTQKDEYKQYILDHQNVITSQIQLLGWRIGRALPMINDKKLTASVREAVAGYAKQIENLQKENPFGIPYRPFIWGAGWTIQKFGVEQYFLHQSFPDLVGDQYFLNALNFVLGCHPGQNTASFASGVGTKSTTIAYGYNRADYSYIPGGVVSGTALIRPDFPELKEFPYLWQQTEYVMGGGATDFMFLVLAADNLLNK
jgi:hypothetical protein